MNTHLKLTSAVTLFISVSITATSNAIADPELSLDDCLEMEFKNSRITPKTALDIGECYLQLATMRVNNHEVVSDKQRKIYSVHTATIYSDTTYLQHADSWFRLAKHGNNPLAEQRIEEVRKLLKPAD